MPDIKKTLSIQLKPLSKKNTVKSKRLSKLVYCVCTKAEDGEFKARLRLVSKKNASRFVCISFTTASYSLNGKLKVFTIKPDKRGKHVCHIRSDYDAKLAPRKSNTYTSFCEDWVYSGRVVKIGKGFYFDIVEAIFHKDFFHKSLDIPEEEVKI